MDKNWISVDVWIAKIGFPRPDRCCIYVYIVYNYMCYCVVFMYNIYVYFVCMFMYAPVWKNGFA